MKNMFAVVAFSVLAARMTIGSASATGVQRDGSSTTIATVELGPTWDSSRSQP